jgi:hypothetical protein
LVVVLGPAAGVGVLAGALVGALCATRPRADAVEYLRILAVELEQDTLPADPGLN